MYIYPNNSVKTSQPAYKGGSTVGKKSIKISEKELMKSLESFTNEKLSTYSGAELIESFEYIQKLIGSFGNKINESLKIKKQKSNKKGVKKELSEFIQSVTQMLNKSLGEEVKDSLKPIKQEVKENPEPAIINIIKTLKQAFIKNSKEKLINSQKQTLSMLKMTLVKLMEPKVTNFSEQRLSNGGLKEYLENWDFYYKNGLTGLYRTSNLLSERLKMTDEEYKEVVERIKGRKIYNKVIERCNKDIEEAILADKPTEEVSQLFDTLNLFIRKYGHYKKPEI